MSSVCLKIDFDNMEGDVIDVSMTNTLAVKTIEPIEELFNSMAQLGILTWTAHFMTLR